MRLLLTRPEPDGARTAAALRARGHEVLCAPLLRIEPIPEADLGDGPYAAVLMTSANAARAAMTHRRLGDLQKLPVLAVGRRTAAAARQAGFTDVAFADSDVADLARRAAAHHGGGDHTLLYLAGEDRAGDLEATLANQLIAVRTVVVYRAVAAELIPPEIAARLAAGGIDGVLHYSRRSAEAFLACADRAGVSRAAHAVINYCLSAAVAAPLAAAGARTIRIAARPDEDVMMDLVGGA